MKRLIALALMCSAEPGWAVDEERFFRSGNELYAQCSMTDAGMAGLCIGYVTGVADAAPAVFIDIPEHATAEQVKDVVVKYLRDHPETRDLPASRLINRALMAIWPRKVSSPEKK